MSTLKACNGIECALYIKKELASDHLRTSQGEIFIHTQKDPHKTNSNEDAMAVFIDNQNKRLIFLVADGMGGGSLGDKASEIVINTITSELKSNIENTANTRIQILDGLEKANQKIIDLKVGAGSTCAAIELSNNTLRSYHVGDSSILVVGQRGKIKLQSVSHSPVAYALESGQINEEEALAHEQLHEISNFVGFSEMRIEIGPFLNITPRDTILLGSDGLFDNLRTEEIIEMIRKGPLKKCGAQLIQAASERMQNPSKINPSKPDDMAFILFRPSETKRRKK